MTPLLWGILIGVVVLLVLIDLMAFFWWDTDELICWLILRIILEVGVGSIGSIFTGGGGDSGGGGASDDW